MICVIDPALQDHAGTPSTNLGDVVIFRAISRCLDLLFPGEEVCRVSSHAPLEEQHYDTIARSRLLFLGGSNLLSSDILTYNQWNFTSNPADYQSPRFNKAILFGIGWWQYQSAPTPFSAEFYRRILDTNALHSVRDGYTAERLREAAIPNVAATACPSMWGLDGRTSHRGDHWSEDCLVMLTDYYMNPADDDAYLRTVLDHFRGTLFYFPQGTGDVAYLRSLPVWRAKGKRIEILEHSLDGLAKFLRSHAVNYVGTRLHGGISALCQGVPSLILGVDNRALEKRRSFNLPVIPRGDRAALKRWLGGERMFDPICLPRQEIVSWLNQFNPGMDPARLFEPAKS